MNPPVPPLLVRRIIIDPLYFVLAPVALAVLVLAGSVCWLLELPTKRKRGARLLFMSAATVLLDWTIFVRCTWAWICMPPWRRDHREWQAQHVRILAGELHRFVLTARWLIGLDLMIRKIPTLRKDRPALVLAQHAGAGDSLLMVYVITHYLHRVPRIVLKRALLWDPAMDLCLRRLDAYFLSSKHISAQQRAAELGAFADKVQWSDATLLFPEGRNWTPDRHADELAEAIAEGETERAEWLRQHTRVLSPRSTGVRRILTAQPESQVVVAGHQGVEELRTVGIIWASLPLARPVHIDLELVEPPADDRIDGWLHAEWGRLDEWGKEISAR